MATLLFQSAGQALGSLFGGPVGAVLGRAAGAIAGNVIDQALFAPRPRRRVGPRLDSLQVMASTEGAPIPRLWGTVRVSGQVIWATNLEEVVTTRKEGGKGSLAAPKAKITEYTYFANFAVGLCEGPVTGIGRVWADGKELELSQFNWRLHRGTDTQAPDSLMEAKQGTGNAPAYRGLAYVVFERLPLDRFGNRLPQLSFEVLRAVGELETILPAVNIIPGTTEFGYDPEPVTRQVGWGETAAENTHTARLITDWTASIDQLQALCPKLGAAGLVVTWFGDDLRCGQCRIRPGVESADKVTSPHTWQVAGVDRASAYVVSQQAGHPAFGGTPSDGSVLRAIADLKARGLEVSFYPFIMMDIPSGNGLADPYGASEQATYPWRGRITCDPAPGRPGTPDKSAAATTQIDALFGTAALADFSVSGGTVVYAGPAEWSLRRMVLHYAHLCALAGGVDTFLIGSEMVGLTSLRASSDSFPAVAQLVHLAADVKQVLPGAKVSYAADWSEYFGYHPDDGSGDVLFHLDEFWAAPAADFVAIDNYMPLSDWREGSGHADYAAGYASIYDPAYLAANIAGGEGYDWYYASATDRDNQIRTSITDGAEGKPWVFRYKDLVNWWSNPHHNRLAGVEQGSPTSWLPEAKPIRFTEAGCPAVDKATNQPNVFYDAKSSENALPWFSTGARDDFIQRRYAETLLDYWQAPGPHNPVSRVYGAPMVDAGRIHFWCWDARPYPAFPLLGSVWTDGANHQRGHWLNGRLGAVPLNDLVAAILDGYGAGPHDTSDIEGVIGGYSIDRPLACRDALEPLAATFNFDGLESAGTLKFRFRRVEPAIAIGIDDLVEHASDEPLHELRRSQENDLPASVKLGYIDADVDYRHASVEARKLTGSSRRETTIEVPCVLHQDWAQARAEILLQEAWGSRETAGFSLPPRFIALEPADVVTVTFGDFKSALRLEQVTDRSGRRIEARQTRETIYELPPVPSRAGSFAAPAILGAPQVELVDLPYLPTASDGYSSWIAAAGLPWPGTVVVVAGEPDETPLTIAEIVAPAVMGVTVTTFASGPLYRLDRATVLEVDLLSGSLSSISDLALFNGANAAAVGSAATGWEIIQFRDAELIAPGRYRLTTLLRGQSGSEPEMLQMRPAASRFVLIDRALTELSWRGDQIGQSVTLRIGPASLDTADPAYRTTSYAPQGLALRPLAPVRLAARDIGGDFELSWIRRTRFNGDNWQLTEVPLNEEAEAYEVDILDGTTVVRTVASSIPQIIYTEAQRQADFGTAQLSQIHIRVAQISSTYGRGASAEEIIDV